MRAMKVNHLHLIVPDVAASSFNAGAPGGFKVEVGA